MYSGTLTPLKELFSSLMERPFHPHIFEVNGRELPLMRIEVPIQIDDYLEWLQAQPLFPKIYWENPQENMRVAALGNVLELPTTPSISSKGGLRFFGGRDFIPRKYNLWNKIPSCSYILPLIEVEEREGHAFLCINRTQETPLVDWNHHTYDDTVAKVVSRLDSPSFPIWERHVNALLNLISHQKLMKVVPARCTRFEFENALNPYSLLKHLQGASPCSTLFAFQFTPEKAFIGASPETLYRRKGENIQSAAVAGTRARGKTMEEDLHLKEDLLSDSKELHEFTIVKKHIEALLSPLCHSMQTQALQVLQTDTVQHLYQAIEGTLKKPMTDHALIQTLHPTPAVGGMPLKEALREIQKREHFDRGWYAAPVGWVTHQECHQLVAIRSALVENNMMSLFAGTGIVEGSTPLKEWGELEQKISQYIIEK